MANIKERWIPVDPDGFFKGLYEISDRGRFKMLPRLQNNMWGGLSLTKEKIISGHTAHGYKIVQLKKEPKRLTIAVHRLVGLAFIQNPENKPYINHKNGVKHDNRAINLEWCTPSENNHHFSETIVSNRKRGEKHPKAKLTEEKVIEIRRLYKNEGHTTRSLAKMFEVGYVRIYDIIAYRTWKHVQ